MAFRTLRILGVAAAMAACGDGGPPPARTVLGAAGEVAPGTTTEAAPAAGAQARLDAGNAAYRAGNYQEALQQYTEATRLAPELAAAWFGVYMAHTALGNAAAADSAAQRAYGLSPDLVVGHPTPESTAGGDREP